MPRPKKGKKHPEPEAPPPVVVGGPEWHKTQGNEQFKIGNYKDAITHYSEAIKADPANIVYYSNRSAAYAAIGTISASRSALADAKKCVELDEKWAKGYYRVGMALVGLGRFIEAKVALDKGSALSPGSEDFVAALESLAKMGVTATGSFVDPEPVPESTITPVSDGVSGGGGGGDGSADGSEVEVVEEEDRFDALNTWLLDNGAVFPLLYMKRYSENYRGVHIRSTVSKETEIMQIPRKCLITVEMGEATEIGRAMKTADLDLSAKKHCFLCVFVLSDRLNPDSFFQPYYRILPTSYPNMPIFWSEDQLEWLTGSYMLTQIADRKTNIRNDYNSICRVAPQFRQFTLEEFSWARMMVASRNFGIKIGETKTDALVPLADMLNHYRPRETRWQFDNSKHAFTITSLVRLMAGNQVYDSYGKKCNSRFLLNYGFAVEDNRDADGQCHNEVRLLVALRDVSADTARGTKVALLGPCGSSRGVRISTWYDHEATQETFSLLRYVWAEPSEVLYLPQVSDESDLAKKPVKLLSWRTEIKVLEHLSQLMQEQLAKYPTTLEEDLKVLKDGVYPFGSDRRNALVIIRGEKEVCHHYVKLAQIAVPILNMEFTEGKRYISKHHSGPSDINMYINAVVEPLLRAKASSGQRGGATDTAALMFK